MMKALISRFNNFTALGRLLFCAGIAAVVFAIAMAKGLEILTSTMVAWDTFCLLMIAVSWAIFLTIQQSELCLKAQEEDESRSMSFVLILASVCISFVSIIVLMKNTDESLVTKGIHQTVSLLGIALSWGLLHTIFTLRYAHLYYTGIGVGVDKGDGGLDFPDDDKPDYLDFAYFSFVVGMTFQVSDVEISSKRIRRVVLLHGLISFVFNTAIVALTISIISNLGK